MPETSIETLFAAFSLFREAILCALVAGAVLGYLGVHVVMRRMVFVTATLTQSAGLGVALSFLAGISLGVQVHPVVGAIIAAMVSAALLSPSPGRLRLSRESVMAFLWLLAGGLAVLVGARISQEAHDIAGILFGSAVLVRPVDLYLVLGLGLPVLVVARVLQSRLVFAGFDPDGARVQGVPVRALDLAFLGMLTLVVAAATRALGALPVFAFSVLPAQAALLLLPALRGVFPLATLIGAAIGVLGYLGAFFFDLPVGAAQTVFAASLVGLAALYRLLRGGS